MVYYNPHITGQYNPLYTAKYQGFFIAHMIYRHFLVVSRFDGHQFPNRIESNRIVGSLHPDREGQGKCTGTGGIWI